MPANYFGSSSSSSGGKTPDIDKITDEVERRLTSDKMSKIQSPQGDRLLLSTQGGDIKESNIETSHIANKVTKIQGATGGKIVLSKVDGEMEESALTPSDVNGKASKIQATS